MMRGKSMPSYLKGQQINYPKVGPCWPCLQKNQEPVQWRAEGLRQAEGGG